jgi:hypothetical protein
MTGRTGGSVLKERLGKRKPRRQTGVACEVRGILLNAHR